MGLWKLPEKVMLPSQYDQAPAPFEFNGQLPDGTQVLAYVEAPADGLLPPDSSGRPGYRFLAAIHEFDADGHHRLVRTRHLSGRYDEHAELGARTSAGMRELMAPYLAAGWCPGAIRVRPFFVQIDGRSHGLLFRAYGGGLEGAEGEREEAVFLQPIGCVFYPPYDSGTYDT